MVVSVDRDSIARAQRRRQAEEALEVERDRMAMLAGQIEELVAELIGARIDEQAFAAMAPEDVEAVRAMLDPQSELGLELDEELVDEAEDDWPADGGATAAEDSQPDEDPAAELEAEISRLESEIAVSRRRQQALERYLEALGA